MEFIYIGKESKDRARFSKKRARWVTLSVASGFLSSQVARALGDRKESLKILSRAREHKLYMSNVQVTVVMFRR